MTNHYDTVSTDSVTELSSVVPSSPRQRVFVASVILLSILMIVLVWIASHIDDWSRDWTTNHAETSAKHPDARLHPISTTLSPRQLSRLTLDVVSDLPRWSIASQPESVREPENANDDRQPIEIKLVHSTMLMRYSDDITVTIAAASDSGSTLNATSQSRIGKGDLGQNPRNLRQLLSAIRRELQTRTAN